MKKLLAILLSALLLCSMIPFATVAAADEPTIVAGDYEANAGDEIQVEVKLLNNPGVIAAMVEIVYDKDVMELVTYYDEDEDDTFNMIESASGWKSSCCFFGPLGKCIMGFSNGTASKNVTKELFYTATFKIKDDAISGTYPLTIVYDPANFFNVDGDDVVFGAIDGSITINGTDPIVPPSCEHEYDAACDPECNLCGELRDVHTEGIIHFDAVEPGCHYNGNIEYWYCPACEGFWADEALTQLTNSKNVILPATGSENLQHVEAVEPSCDNEGNIEYWFCPDCEQYWQDAALTQLTNSKNVKIGATDHNIVHIDAVDPGCHYIGNIEYWYCTECEIFWQDEALTQITNSKNVIVPALGGDVVAFEAVEPGCHYDGNIAYWVCYECEQVWQDEALTQLTNIKNVVLPAIGSENLQHVEAKAPTATENGNIEYWYCADCEQYWQDEALTQLTNSKNVILPATGEIPSCNHEYDNVCDYDCNLCGEYREAPHSIQHVEAVAPSCYENGNIEYWYCTECGYAWLDADCTLNTNLLAVVLPMAHAEATHVAAVAPSCFENGNIEYWYCAECGQAWLDEACTLNTNLLAVVLPMAHAELTHVAAVDATCTATGNIEYWYCADCGYAWLDAEGVLSTNLLAVVLPQAEHTYDDEYDADCNVCGEVREVAAKAFAIISEGASASEDVSGLAFLFTVNATNIKVDEDRAFQGATIVIDGVEYNLVKVGAILTNQKEMIDIEGKYLWEWPAADADSFSFAVRAINIPEQYYDRTITATPYYVYEDAEGNLQKVMYNSITASSYAEEMAKVEE